MLRPVDILVLSAIALDPEPDRTQAQVAHQLGISQSNVHRALKQLDRSGLLRSGRPRRAQFLRLLVAAVRSVYPAQLGPPARGLLTAQTNINAASNIAVEDKFVWPFEEGSAYGTAVTPLHPSVPRVSSVDPEFHRFMALIDVLRIGRVREKALAESQLAGMLRVES